MQTANRGKTSFTAFMSTRLAELEGLSNRCEAAAKQQAWHDFQHSVYLYETDPALIHKAAHKAYSEAVNPLHCTKDQYCHWYCNEADLIQQAASQKTSSKAIAIGLCASILAIVIWLMFFAA